MTDKEAKAAKARHDRQRSSNLLHPVTESRMGVHKLGRMTKPVWLGVDCSGSSLLTESAKAKTIKQQDSCIKNGDKSEFPFSPTFVIRPDLSNLPKEHPEDVVIRRWAATFVAYHAMRANLGDCQLAFDLRVKRKDGGPSLLKTALDRLKVLPFAEKTMADISDVFTVISNALEPPTFNDRKTVREASLARAEEKKVQIGVLQASAAAVFGCPVLHVANLGITIRNAAEGAVGGLINQSMLERQASRKAASGAAGYSSGLPLLTVPLVAYLRHRPV